MKLPVDALIAPAKLTDYLLVPRQRNDKSRWLSQAGYNLENWHRLEHDLRTQLLSLEVVPTESTSYGQKYEIAGLLKGPNGNSLAVRSIWMTESATGITKFITIFPDRR